MRWLILLCGLFAGFLTGCQEAHRALPLPTPAQRDLVVLVQNGPLTYEVDEQGNASGLEYDLIETFAREMGVGLRLVPVEPETLAARLQAGEAHFAATWGRQIAGTVSGTPFRRSNDIIIQHEASLPIQGVEKLTGKTIHVVAGSRQAVALQALQAAGHAFGIVERRDLSAFDLMKQVEEQLVPLVAVDSTLFDIAQQFAPSLMVSLTLGEGYPIGWIFPQQHNSELLARANDFIAKARGDGTLARLEDRYFGHIRRLDQADVLKFMERMETVLPKLRKFFLQAQTASDIDWRLIAAVAYQESNWDPAAVSPTGVRGIMMLTEDTADHLGVSNRLDPKESIVAGARYIDYLRSQMPALARDPDRTWLALSAYNIGPGHFNVARNLALQLKANPTSWYEMKRVLPLLAQPKYYQRLKSGRARGGEAVIMVENIRSYYDILLRHESAFHPIPTGATGRTGIMGMSGMAGSGKPGLGPGLKLKAEEGLNADAKPSVEELQAAHVWP